ncbi:hypothetical protein F5887DRAFT_922223, partial [Amanita rubescens]
IYMTAQRTTVGSRRKPQVTVTSAATDRGYTICQSCEATSTEITFIWDTKGILIWISTAVLMITVRDKSSPRKRRMTGSKGRRREMDDGDATYPVKRARLPRIDDVNIVTQGLEAQQGEGRPLRSRGQVRQRTSDASESACLALRHLGKCKHHTAAIRQTSNIYPLTKSSTTLLPRKMKIERKASTTISDAGPGAEAVYLSNLTKYAIH